MTIGPIRVTIGMLACSYFVQVFFDLVLYLRGLKLEPSISNAIS